MSDIGDNKNIRKLLQIRSSFFLFTIPRAFKDFAYFLGRANLRNNSLLVRTIYIACTIHRQRLIVPNLNFIGVVLGRCLE